MAKRLDPLQIAELVERYTPTGWRVVQSMRRYHSHSGLAVEETKTLYVPTVLDPGSLFIFFHECGHVVLGHFEARWSQHVEEFEAETYAIRMMRAEQIPIPRWVMREAKSRVRGHLESDVRKKRVIAAHVKRWAA